MTLFKWSRTASSNATADSTINWAEGQAPSSINDSARAEMAAVAKYRDDIAGAITTSGSSTAYAISSYQGFDTLANMDGKVIAFTPHATNDGTSTLNVDGLGAKPLRSAPSVELPAGTLILGTPYVATYNNTAGVWYLQGFYGNPYSLPIGGLLPFAGSTAPNSSFVLPYGQAISRTTYATLFAATGTAFGVGDGTTTFNLPDIRGRIIAGRDDMGGPAAGRLTSAYFGNAATLIGAVGGSESHTLTLDELPTGITSGGSVSVTSTASNILRGTSINATVAGGANNMTVFNGTPTSTSVTSTGSNTLTSNNTAGQAHVTVQPTIVLNCIMRII